MPAFLHKNLFSGIYIRIKNSIHIYIHKITIIHIIAACHRIYRLIRICHRVKKCVKRTLYQFDKRILNRILCRTAQNRMFKYMRYSRTVRRRCTKSYRKYLILIIISQYKNSCTGLSVSEKIPVGFQFFYSFFLYKFIFVIIKLNHSAFSFQKNLCYIFYYETEVLINIF